MFQYLTLNLFSITSRLPLPLLTELAQILDQDPIPTLTFPSSPPFMTTPSLNFLRHDSIPPSTPTSTIHKLKRSPKPTYKQTKQQYKIVGIQRNAQNTLIGIATTTTQ